MVEAAQVNQLLPVADPHEDLIDEEGVAVASMLSLQSPEITGVEFDGPQSDELVADSDTSFGKDIFDITMTEVEATIEPDSIADYAMWNRCRFEIPIHRFYLIRPVNMAGSLNRP